MSEKRAREMVEREPEAVTSSAGAISRAVETATGIEDDELPGVRFYEFSDGSTTVAVEGVWVSAIFESYVAARSWVVDRPGDERDSELTRAESRFRRNDRRPIGARTL